MTDLSGCLLESLREGPDFTLYRVRRNGNPSPVGGQLGGSFGVSRPSGFSSFLVPEQPAFARRRSPQCKQLKSPRGSSGRHLNR
jgi:hypothetical protein